MGGAGGGAVIEVGEVVWEVVEAEGVGATTALVRARATTNATVVPRTQPHSCVVRCGVVR